MIRLHSVALFVWTLASLSFSATSAVGQDRIPRILNGTPTTDFPSVGIVGDQIGGFCSGTLISPNHVLTAAHCAEIISGSTGGTFELESGLYTTSTIFIHPDYNPQTLDNDIAILELSQPAIEEPSLVFGGIKPDGDPLIGGEVLTIVGFGAGGGTGGSDGTFGVKMFGFVMIDAVSPTLILWTFDDPTESNTAPGDSGGPGFLEIEGELFVASITSGGSLPDAGLGDMAFNTRVDAYLDWIDGIISSIPAPPGDPGDDPTIPGNDDCPLLDLLCPGGHLQNLAELLSEWCGFDEVIATIQSWFQPPRGLGLFKNPNRGNGNMGNAFGQSRSRGQQRGSQR